ncbi:MAG: BMP family ABC transporter substrate-binding protein [Ruminococcaceae bacterium]|nr:BMP family ABC transporter substrate-binding protein [Oscillospiraceae bacterium]
MKRILSVILVMSMLLSCFLFASCGAGEKEGGADAPVAKSDFKLGVICLHDEKSTYDKNFIDAVKKAQKELGLKDEQIIFKKNIPETNACYDAAADLVDAGCNVVFANSFGHESFLLKAAKEFKDVQFCHATGTMAHTEKLPNFHNAFAEIYEGRYLVGIAAGLKLKEMMDKDPTVVPKIGYVGAFTYAEVISGYTSFYLGVKEIVPEVTMEVQFTGSWYDEIEEKNAANALIQNGCVLISQHADSMGAPTACEEKGIPNISYNISNAAACPKTFIVASKIDWTPYFKLICEKTMAGKGKEIPVDYTGTIETGSVVLTEINEKAAAAGTAKAIEEYKKQLVGNTRQVFEVKNFTATVTDEKNKNATTDAKGVVTSYMADVDTDAEFAADTEVVTKTGVLMFEESKYRSAPYFDLQIDGIKLLNAKF